MTTTTAMRCRLDKKKVVSKEEEERKNVIVGVLELLSGACEKGIFDSSFIVLRSWDCWSSD